jgi:ectoine hydroxylase-related dioxygenase (phytanoyl-CoA dioxygenase family)
MLTARIHLDDMTEDNGPLKVIPGSHQLGKQPSRGDVPPRALLGTRGDVLLMRPLLEHCSGRSHPDTPRHRRVLHLEFAASRELPDGYTWFQFIPGAAPKTEISHR